MHVSSCSNLVLNLFHHFLLCTQLLCYQFYSVITSSTFSSVFNITGCASHLSSLTFSSFWEHHATQTHKLLLGFDIHMSVHRNIITNYSQQDAAFLEFISTDALHVSGGSSTHHQEHVTVHTASGIVKQYYCQLLPWTGSILSTAAASNSIG
jgi:hypothetical protein